MGALLYEYFVRNAFGNVERGGDPAGLAEADMYNMSFSDGMFLNKLKIGTSYAMAIYNANYMEAKKLQDPEDCEKMENFLKGVLEAESGNEIVEIIKQYQNFETDLKKLPNR